MTDIDLEDVRDGDWLTILDSRHNRLRGPVEVQPDGIAIAGFSVSFPVAKRGRMTHRLTPVAGLKVLEHQPQLFPS